MTTTSKRPPRRRLIWPTATALLVSAAMLASPPAPATSAPEAAAAAVSVDVPSAVAVGTPNTPAGRLAAIKRSGIQVSVGDTVIIDATGSVDGNPDPAVPANGPAGSTTDGATGAPDFPGVPGGATLYSLVAKIDPAGSDGGATNSDTWFYVGDHVQVTAATAGELVFVFHDALYVDDWLPSYVDNVGSFNAQVQVLAPLVVQTGGPYTATEGQLRALDGTIGSNVTAASWTFPRPIGGGAVPPCAYTNADAVDTTVRCTDDGAFELQLTGTDGTRQNRPRTTLTVTNQPPVAAPLVWTPSSGCSGRLSSAFTDPGTSDTHTATVNWADHSTAPVGVTETAGAGIAQGTHTFAAGGSYQVEMIVSDDDGGSTAAQRTVRLANQSSPFKQPVNVTGARSVFAKGSTIRLKLAITDCAGKPVAGLSPTVAVTKVRGKAGRVNEVVSHKKGTPGTSMVARGRTYRFNLDSGAAGLAKGVYRITVSDPSLTSPRVVLVGLR